jgi:hypothetical protein
MDDALTAIRQNPARDVAFRVNVIDIERLLTKKMLMHCGGCIHDNSAKI